MSEDALGSSAPRFLRGLTSLVLVVLQAALCHSPVILLNRPYIVMVGCRTDQHERSRRQVSISVAWNALFSLAAVATEAGLLCSPGNLDGNAPCTLEFDNCGRKRRLSCLLARTLRVCESLAAERRCVGRLARLWVRNAGRRGCARRAAHARILAAGDESQNRRRCSITWLAGRLDDVAASYVSSFAGGKGHRGRRSQES